MQSDHEREKGHEKAAPEQPLTQAELERRERDLRERERRVDRRARDLSRDRHEVARRERDLRDLIQTNRRRTEDLNREKDNHLRTVKQDVNRTRFHCARRSYPSVMWP